MIYGSDLAAGLLPGCIRLITLFMAMAAQRKYQYLALGPFKQGLLVKGQVVCASGFMVT